MWDVLRDNRYTVFQGKILFCLLSLDLHSFCSELITLVWELFGNKRQTLAVGWLLCWIQLGKLITRERQQWVSWSWEEGKLEILNLFFISWVMVGLVSGEWELYWEGWTWTYPKTDLDLMVGFFLLGPEVNLPSNPHPKPTVLKQLFPWPGTQHFFWSCFPVWISKYTLLCFLISSYFRSLFLSCKYIKYSDRLIYCRANINYWHVSVYLKKRCYFFVYIDLLLASWPQCYLNFGIDIGY